jgi:hypothetical protein
MKEKDFDALVNGRSFGTEDAMRIDAQLRHIFALGAVLGAGLPTTCSVNY